MTAVLDARATGTRPQALRRNAGFRMLWFGEGVSVFGTATSAIMMPLLAVVQLHAGPGWMGLLAAATWLPWLVIGVPAGALTDQLAARTVMIVADLVSAVALLSVPIAAACAVLSITQLLGVALVTGTCTVFFRAAYPSLLRHVVDADQLTAANARMFGTESAASVAGPGIGGWLAGAFGAAAGLVVDAVSFVVSAICLWQLPKRNRCGPAIPERSSATETGSVRTRAVEGLRFVYTDPLLRLFSLTGGISNFGLTGLNALLVLFLARNAELPAQTIGVLLAIGSSGGIAGAAAAGRLSAALGSARALVVSQLLCAPAPLVLVLVHPGPSIVIVPIAMAALACGVVGGNVIRGGFRMRYVPADLQGRAVTASQLINFGTMPLAGLVAGALGETIGLRSTIAVMAAVHAGACIATACSRVRGWRDLPESRSQ